jgi:hypothetical protein
VCWGRGERFARSSGKQVKAKPAGRPPGAAAVRLSTRSVRGDVFVPSAAIGKPENLQPHVNRTRHVVELRAERKRPNRAIHSGVAPLNRSASAAGLACRWTSRVRHLSDRSSADGQHILRQGSHDAPGRDEWREAFAETQRAHVFVACHNAGVGTGEMTRKETRDLKCCLFGEVSRLTAELWRSQAGQT